MNGKKSPGRQGLVLGFGFAILLSILIVFNRLSSDRTIEIIHDGKKINRIVMRVQAARDSEDVTIVDSSELDRFNRMLKMSREVPAGAARLHTSFIDVDVYKDKKVNISILNTDQSGWVVIAGGNWYKSDSLVDVLRKYIPNTIN
jgi:hypothetical protein